MNNSASKLHVFTIVILLTVVLIPFAFSQTNLYWVEDGLHIKKFDIGSDEIENIYTLIGQPELDKIRGIEIDQQNDKIYLNIAGVFPNDDILASINFDGSNYQSLGVTYLSASFEQPLFHSSSEEVLYFQQYNDLVKFDLNTLNREVIATQVSGTSLDFFDPVNKRLFWGIGVSQFNYFDIPSLENIEVDIDLDNESIFEVTGYNILTNKIYFRGSTNVFRSNLDGSEVETIVNPIEPGDLGLFYRTKLSGNHIYSLEQSFTTTNFHTISRYNIETGQREILKELEDVETRCCLIAKNDSDIEEGFSIDHHHKISNHPEFSNTKYLKSLTQNSANNEQFYVCVDGSQASVFQLNDLSLEDIESEEYYLRTDLSQAKGFELTKK